MKSTGSVVVHQENLHFKIFLNMIFQMMMKKYWQLMKGVNYIVFRLLLISVK